MGVRDGLGGVAIGLYECVAVERIAVIFISFQTDRQKRTEDIHSTEKDRMFSSEPSVTNELTPSDSIPHLKDPLDEPTNSDQAQLR